jgi:hypothetical protein
MRINRCQHCNRIFSPESSGKYAILCRPCGMDCDVAYVKVYQLICDKKYKEGLHLTRVHINLIAEESQISPVFVRILFDEGRFGKEDDEATDTNNCKRCEKPLSEGEKGMCSPCIGAISKEVNKGFDQNKNVTGKKPDPNTPYNSRYGLGADRGH